MLSKIKGFIKGLSSSKEKTPAEKVSAEELEAWFNSKADIILSRLNETAMATGKRLASELSVCKEKLSALEQAELRNPNITEREKSFMKGNRENYLRQVRMFIGRIPENLKGAEEFIRRFDSELDSLGKSTFRSFQILQEFFAHETKDVASAIKQISDSAKELKNHMKESGIESISEVKGLIESLKNKLAKRKEMNAELEALKERYERAGNAFRITGSQLEEFLKSGQSRKAEELKAKEASILESIRSLESGIIHDFAILEKALKKFEKVSFDKSELAKQYLENPVNALVADFELRIVDVLRDLERNIDSLDVRDRKRDKTIETIAKLDKEHLSRFLAEYNKLIRERNSTKAQLKELGTEEKHKSLSQELEMRKRDIAEIEGKIQRLNDELSKDDAERIKKEIQEKTKKLLNTELLIT